MTGTIFDIQHYSVHDGPGIRTLVFFKGCPLRCLWCCNPESQDFGPEIEHRAVHCRSCLRCLGACLQDAITADGGAIRINRDFCARCDERLCLEACPEGALHLVGRTVEASWVMERVVADIDFYRNSGGGATFSGGEPFAQPGFLLELLERCRRSGIHTAVETCGFGNSSDFASAEPLTDLFLFDLKLLDPERHERDTERPNGLILGNIRYLAGRSPEKLIIRVPLIPGFTDDLPNLQGIVAFVRDLGLHRVELEPYHPLGRTKYIALGRGDDAVPAVGLPSAESVQEAQRIFRSSGLECEIGGF